MKSRIELVIDGKVVKEYTIEHDGSESTREHISLIYELGFCTISGFIMEGEGKAIADIFAELCKNQIKKYN